MIRVDRQWLIYEFLLSVIYHTTTPHSRNMSTVSVIEAKLEAESKAFQLLQKGSLLLIDNFSPII